MSIKIAVVDDKRILRTTLIEQLSFYEEVEVVLQSCDGKEFLSSMKALKTEEIPQVVLMDIEMPVLDGIEAVAIGKQIYPDVHFLMLTVFDDDDKLFEAIKAGASGYLLKDERIANIVKSITELVHDGGVPMSPRIARKALSLLRNTPEKLSSPKEIGESGVLSSREMEILNRIVDGLNYNEIGERLFISPHTVRKHIANIYDKLHVTNKASAIKVAMVNKWFSQ
ncbi:MAG TPA: response regulator transcription factor [Pedobacter sp.]|jgi:DNA-binding NarL/FixJ family response regulator